jgi:hypothetical protein
MAVFDRNKLPNSDDLLGPLAPARSYPNLDEALM